MKRMNTIDRKEYIAFPGRQGTEKYYARLNIILWVINKNVLGIYYAEKETRIMQLYGVLPTCNYQRSGII